MIKSLLLATTFIISVPAFAQDMPATTTAPAGQSTTSPAQTATAPAPAEPATDPAASASMAETTKPADAAQPATPATAAAPTAAAPPTATPAPAATGTQVADAVSKEFTAYDRDASGGLSAAEFGAWMTNLRKASEPQFVAGSAEAQAWQLKALTQADTDKNASISQSELTAFLTPKPS